MMKKQFFIAILFLISIGLVASESYVIPVVAGNFSAKSLAINENKK